MLAACWGVGLRGGVSMRFSSGFEGVIPVVAGAVEAAATPFWYGWVS